MKRYDGAFLSEWDKGRWVEYSDVEVLEKENELLRKQIQCDSVDEGCNLYEETGVVCYRHLHHFYETTSKQIKENHDRAEEIIKGREKTIAHLHEQLAEKDARIKALTQGDPCWYDMNEADAFRMWAADRVKLAEKEKEVERLTQLHMSVYNEACDDLKSTFALERLLLEQKVRELEEEKEVLTECLNGSSKAHYTAELYDKGITEAHATGRREGIEESATLVEERERKRWEQVGDPRTPSFTPYYAIAIRKAAQQS